jgi:nucleoporin POM152
VLNPELHPFCLGGDRKTAPLPIFFNATIPVEVELIRTDLETNQQESIKLTRVQIRDIERKAKRESQEGVQTVVQYDYLVKKPGAYRLGRVLDEYKLEVQRRNPQTFVVPCPKAWVGPSSSPGRCVGDLSDVSLQVEGTPPLKIKYSRTINGKDHSFHFQSLQPEGFTSPLGVLRSTSLVGLEDDDISWARSHRVPVGLNESMHASGEWQYSVDEVQDGFGNLVKYDSAADDLEGKPKPKHLVQNFVVKERPQVRLEGCDLRRPLKVAKGDSKELPVRFKIAGQTPDITAHTLTWHFSPIDTLTESGDHGDVVSTGTYNARNARDRPMISEPGLYTLKSVSASSCEGEVQEPSSCLLLNPLEPKVTVRSEEIPDTCAGNSIGLRVDMDLIGTPPFIVRYDVISNGQRRSERVNIPGLRYQMDLIPRVAGHHKYIFTHIGDAIYNKGQKLTGSEYVLEQDVKPAAAALIQHSTGKVSSCLGDEVTVDILLLGDAPFTLEWEVIHDGKRKQHKATDIQENSYQIKTKPLTQGGEYTLGLTSVQDKRGCRNFLQDELKISVRRQSPRAAFGLVEGKRKMLAVEGSAVKLPVRLTGEGPWKVFYTRLEDGPADSPKILERTVRNDNGFIDVKERGAYTITDVWDNQCHGVVDPKASTFEVDWFPRPEISVALSHGVSQTDSGYVVEDVCEGDVSGFEVALKGKSSSTMSSCHAATIQLTVSGTPPYTVEYEVRHHPLQGSSSLSKRKFDASLGKESIQADTTKAGLYTYKFTALEDNLYSSDRKFKPLVVKQKVNRKPSASFVKPGQTFKYCKSEQDNEDGIPVALTGVPPFALEIEIKHQSAAVPEIYRTPSINSNTYEIRIPRHQLRLGTQHVRIRDVKDGSGCHSMAELGGPSVQVQLFEAPTIYPLETRTDYCVGERISYTLSGTPPFEVWYTFDGVERKAKSPTTNFRRVAESPGEFTITTLSDKASECRAPVHIAKTIHPMPAVRISKGKNVRVDIHEGGEVEILFEFWGTPPFEFTYTRSTNARKGQKSQVLETRHDVSHEHSKIVRASQEGTYEVVAIKDKFCAFSTQGVEVGKEKGKVKGQKVIKY